MDQMLNKSTKQRIITGFQPTNALHIGNYLGAVEPFVKEAQNKQYQSFCFIADLHSITVRVEPEDLRQNVCSLAAMLLSAGLEQLPTSLFLQSSIKEHAELGWLLGCIARIGWLNRMTQFKEKTGKNKEQASVGLYYYPVLMAADILLYSVSRVPVGEDQKQHLEFARDLATKFNKDYKTDFFQLPEPIILPKARIMSLRDATKKMSKSDPVEASKILLTDDSTAIASKVMKAKTDAFAIPESVEELDSRRELHNLLNIYSLATGTTIASTLQLFAGKNHSFLKQELAAVLTSKIAPITIRYNEIIKDVGYIQSVLEKGRQAASNIAQVNLCKIKHIMGLS